MNGWFLRKKYIDILVWVRDKQEKSIGSDERPTPIGLKSGIKGYSDKDIDKSIKYLVSGGYLLKNDKNLGITERGKSILEDFFSYEIQNIFAKINIIIGRNFESIISIMSLIISIMSLIVSIFALIFPIFGK